MPRGKNTNVYLSCTSCKMQNYKTRINKRTIEGKLELRKFCKKCNKAVVHASGSEIKHSSK